MEVFGTETYLEQVDSLTNEYKAFANSLPKKLKENPFQGKQLAPSLREKRIKDKRIYFLVYEDLNLVLLVAISNKKNQQTIIDNIKNMLNEYKKYATKLVS